MLYHIEAIEAVKLLPPHHFKENTSLDYTHTCKAILAFIGWRELRILSKKKKKKETKSGVINIKILYTSHKILLSNQLQEIETYFPPN